MKSRIVHPDPSNEVYTDERCFILEAWNSPEDEALSIALARVSPGVTTALHAVEGIAERYLVVSGEALVEVDGLPPETIKEGDVVVVAAGAPQRVTNVGSEDFVFYALCTPRFKPSAYRAVEAS